MKLTFAAKEEEEEEEEPLCGEKQCPVGEGKIWDHLLQQKSVFALLTLAAWCAILSLPHMW